MALIKGKTAFTCSLGHSVLYERSDKLISSPKPGENCYRPVTEEELAEATILIGKRKAKKNVHR